MLCTILGGHSLKMYCYLMSVIVDGMEKSSKAAAELEAVVAAAAPKVSDPITYS
jgi:hypothetical protein